MRVERLGGAGLSGEQPTTAAEAEGWLMYVHKLKSTAILYLNMSVITSALEMIKAHNFLSHALEGVVKQISKNLSLSGVHC